MLVNAESLGGHIDKRRSEFLPALIDALSDPFEVWTAFEKHNGSGKIVMRQRIIKAIDIGNGKGIIVVLNAVKGIMTAWTFIPSSKMKELNKRRRGSLVYERS